MKKLTTLSILTAAISLSFASVAVEIPEQIITQHTAGLNGDANANQNAIDALQILAKEDATDAVLYSLLGSSETAQARYVDQPWQKMKFAEKGLAHLDKSLNLLKRPDTAPNVTFQVTTTAACTFIKVPKMFNRFEQGYGLIQGLVSAPGFAYAPARAKVGAYLCAIEAATAAKNTTQALAFIEQVNKIAPQGPHIAALEKFKAQNTELAQAGE
ncbi:hypothetical protein [Pseudoalteromonas tunicata]|jgi:hypothetical protein|uniref:Orphan protein n=1 Tax=Pseudoalteromonas tunicata D2 TaxID=87626 RepID=A4CDP4_9GAMM|nr:hypothetical protein [Pseudoalteromonas tunicata]ATC96423.1 hypothetical protein PTUN_a4222 [Pseudoalteromonas tunicata]AXT31910.1 hypothetical protein D1819_14515 [Pseudoalteromonas tunicata]EAR27086.1 hypothetical protein PTD2_05430 [Pseudoalteromonas tunicata D2]